MPRIHKHGGMWFFRWGRFGGSIYLSRRTSAPDYRDGRFVIDGVIVATAIAAMMVLV